MTMKLDPRTKLVMVALLLTTLAIVYNTPGALFLAVGSHYWVVAAFSFNLIRVMGYLKPYLMLLLVLFLAQCILLPGGEDVTGYRVGTPAGNSGIANGNHRSFTFIDSYCCPRIVNYQ